MEQRYPYYIKWDKDIMVVLHIYGPRAISLPLCNHLYTESESLDMEMDIGSSYYNNSVIGKILLEQWSQKKMQLW